MKHETDEQFHARMRKAENWLKRYRRRNGIEEPAAITKSDPAYRTVKACSVKADKEQRMWPQRREDVRFGPDDDSVSLQDPTY